MPLYLNVPYDQKDVVKLLGAKWDSQRKQWVAVDKYSYYKFLDWIPFIDADYNTIICDYIYIIETIHTCFKCKQKTNVISLAYQNNMTICKENGHIKQFKYNDSKIYFVEMLEEFIDERFMALMKTRFGVYKSYSKTTKDAYFANHCQHCGIIQGQYYLYEELMAPFSPVEYGSARKYNAYKIMLQEDLSSVFYEPTGEIKLNMVTTIQDIPEIVVSLMDL